jgi:spermidine synthase
MVYDESDNRTMWFANWHSDEVYQFIKSDVLHTEQTDIQKLEVIETEVYGRLMLLNGEIQIATESDAAVHEAMCHPPMLLHRNPENVLIVGGGDGGSTREVLKHNPNTVDVVEIDSRVIEISKEYFDDFSSKLEDDKVNIHIEDGRAFVEDCSRTYDVVIMDISDPMGPAKTVFTSEFYDIVKRIMSEDSVMVTHCESPDSSGDVFYRVLSTLENKFDVVRPYRHWVPAYVDFWGRAVATDRADPLNLSIEDLEKKIKNREINLDWLTPELCHSMFRSLNREVKDKMAKDWDPITEENLIDFERP